VNYDLGYSIGDDILRRIAAVLQEDDSPDRVRAADVVARYSGEEFVLLLPETGKASALTKAARLRDAVAVAEMPGGAAKDRAKMRRNVESAIQQLNDLGIVVEEWPTR